jgi:hypothetical protein
MAKYKNQKSNRIGKHSITNRLSSAVISLSKVTGVGLALAPNAFGGVRGARAGALKFQRHGRDVNALMKGNVRNRVNNRVKGLIGGRVVNAVLPNTNNIVLRLARGAVGSYLNKAIHKQTKGLNMLEIFGPKATAKAHKEILNMQSGSLFYQMQNQMAFVLRSLAPRTEFTMNIGGTKVEFGPNNLADSVMIHEVQHKPEPNVVAKWTVSVGGNKPEPNVADKAPYVWIANYGGMLFNPLDPKKPKAYAPTFFAERSLEFIERQYKPVIKKMYELFAPKSFLEDIASKNRKLDPSKFLTKSYADTHKSLQKVWLSKDGAALKKEIEKASAKNGGKTVKTSYKSSDAGEQDFMAYYKKYFGLNEYGKDGRMFQESLDDGAMAAMSIMYGDEFIERTVIKETLKKTKPTNQRRTRVREEVIERVPLSITTGTGRVPIYADMRELKNKNGQFKAGVGAAGHYKNTMIEPGKVSIQKDYRFDLGEIIFDERTRNVLQQLERQGAIKAVKNNKTGKMEIEVLDADRLVKELELEAFGGFKGDLNYVNTKKNPNYRDGDSPQDLIDRVLKNQGRGTSDRLGVSASGRGANQSVMDSAATTARVNAERDALQQIVNEINKALPPQMQEKKIKVSGGRRYQGKSNREHLHTLKPNDRKIFRQHLRETGQKLDDEFYLSKKSHTRTILTNNQQYFKVQQDNQTGQLKIVSDTNKQLVEARKVKGKLESELDELKRKKNKIIEDLKANDTLDPKLDQPRTRAILKNFEEAGLAAPTDARVPQYMWKLSKSRAPNDMVVDGFGPVKKGQRIPFMKDDTKPIDDLLFGVNLAKNTGPVFYNTEDLNQILKDVRKKGREIRSATKKVNTLQNKVNREQSLFFSDKSKRVSIQGKSFKSNQGQKAIDAGAEAYAKTLNKKGPRIFNNVRVSGTSNVIRSKGNIIRRDRINTDTYRAFAGEGDNPELTFTFRNATSRRQADRLGLFAYKVRVSRPKLGGGHHNPGRAIKPIVERKGNTNLMDLTYKDPSLPTAKLVIRQRINKQGKITSIDMLDTGGTKIKPVTTRGSRAIDFVNSTSAFDDIRYLNNVLSNETEEPARSRVSGRFVTDTTNRGLVIRFEDR